MSTLVAGYNNLRIEAFFNQLKVKVRDLKHTKVNKKANTIVNANQLIVDKRTDTYWILNYTFSPLSEFRYVVGRLRLLWFGINLENLNGVIKISM